MKKALYATIGHRLSMHITSPTGYNYSNGKANLDDAYYDFFTMGNFSPKGFKVETIDVENVNFFDGPNILVGLPDDDGLIDPLFAFIYDDLKFRGDSLQTSFYDAYQAKVIFQETLKPEDDHLICSALKHALTLMSLKENMHSLVHSSAVPIVLGVDKSIIAEFPKISATFLESGFKQNDQTQDGSRFNLFSNNTQLTP